MSGLTVATTSEFSLDKTSGFNLSVQEAIRRDECGPTAWSDLCDIQSVPGFLPPEGVVAMREA